MTSLSISDCVNLFDQQIQLKPKQFDCLQHLLAGRDVIANLPVGYGKSLIYQVLPIILKNIVGITKPVVVVISPLNIIQCEQIEVLRQHSVPACRLAYCDRDGESDLEDMDVVKRVIQGEFEVVFAHPEALLNTAGGKQLLSDENFIEKVGAVVIDECHIVETW